MSIKEQKQRYYQKYKSRILAAKKIYYDNNLEESKEKHRKYYVEHRDEINEKRRQQRLDPEYQARVSEQRKAQYAANKEAHAHRQRRSRYALSPDEYHKLLEEQGGACAICGATEKLFVDHDHTTGKVRGLLCLNCNAALGHVKENETILSRLIGYLKSHATN